MSILKSLSANSNISVTLGLACIDRLFFFQFKTFLVFEMISDLFKLKPETSGNYAMGLWILFKIFVIVGFC